jgi:MFS family permease
LARNASKREARAPLFVLFLASLVFTMGDGSIQILISPHLQAKGVSAPLIGPIVGAYSVASLCFRFITGAVYRADRIRYLIPGGCLLQAASFVLLANSEAPTLLTIATMLNGTGFAIASTGGMAAVMELRPASNAGILMGWYTGCISAGYAASGFLGGLAGDLLGIQTAITTLAALPVLAACGLAMAVWRIEPSGGNADKADDPKATGGRLRGLRDVHPFVLLAFFCALHINLLSGVLHTFFPLYGLAIGLSLTQIGSLSGMSSAVGSAIRFASPALFKRVSYRALLPWMVILGGLAVAGLTISTVFIVLAVGWIGIGASRAVLRVSSAALVMDASSAGSDRGRGAASALYMSGLDLGKIIGPVAGGFSVEALGYEWTFLIAGFGVPLAFFSYYGWLRFKSVSAIVEQTDDDTEGA